MGRRAVEVEVVLLHVLAVVALAVGQSEEPLLENRILAVPQGQCEAEMLLVVGDAGDAVLAPAIRPRSGMIVGEEIPGVAVLAIVFADGAPLPLAQVGPPFFPRHALFSRRLQPQLLLGHRTYPIGLGIPLVVICWPSSAGLLLSTIACRCLIAAQLTIS